MVLATRARPKFRPEALQSALILCQSAAQEYQTICSTPFILYSHVQPGEKIFSEPACLGVLQLCSSTCTRSVYKSLRFVLPCRFEQLALGYDSDQIGDLEEDPDEAQGCADLDTYGNVLDDFLESFATADHAHESGARYHTLAEQAPKEAARLRVSANILTSCTRTIICCNAQLSDYELKSCVFARQACFIRLYVAGWIMCGRSHY